MFSCRRPFGLFLFGFVTLSGVQFARAQGAAKSDAATAQAVELIGQVQQSILQSPEAHDCGVGSGPLAGKSCNFVNICERLKSNKDSLDLYRNAEGEVLPNFKLRYSLMAADRCASNMAEKSAGKDEIAAQNLAAQKEYAARQGRFLDSIEKNSEAPSYVKIQKELLKMSLEDAENKPQTMGMPSREEVEGRILEAQKRAGVTLSKESMDLWVMTMAPMKGPQRRQIFSYDDPYLDTDLFVDTQKAGSAQKVKSNQASFRNQAARSFDIFKDTKKEIIEVLLQRRNAQNAGQIDDLIKRIETVKMELPPSLHPMALAQTGCRGPNAYYSPAGHRFVLCPSIMRMPSATLQMIIAHELGHSIDPCIATFPLQKISGKEKEDPDNSPDKKAQQVAMARELGFLLFDPKLPDQGSDQFGAFDPGYLKRAYSKAYDDLSVDAVTAGVPFSKNPMSSVISCLQTKQSVDARLGDVNMAKAAVKQKIDNLKKSGAQESSPEVQELKATLARIDSEWAEKRACSFMGSRDGKSQMQEAFSDWLGAQVLARKMKSAPSEAQAGKMAFEATGFFASLECRSFEPDMVQKVRDARKAAGCDEEDNGFSQDLMAMQVEDDPHPESHARMTRILMSNPGLAKALKCTPEAGVKHCE